MVSLIYVVLRLGNLHGDRGSIGETLIRCFSCDERKPLMVFEIEMHEKDGVEESNGRMHRA